MEEIAKGKARTIFSHQVVWVPCLLTGIVSLTSWNISTVTLDLDTDPKTDPGPDPKEEKAPILWIMLASSVSCCVTGQAWLIWMPYTMPQAQYNLFPSSELTSNPKPTLF